MAREMITLGIDDRAAWAQRMKQGLDATVRSAINGQYTISLQIRLPGAAHATQAGFEFRP